VKQRKVALVLAGVLLLGACSREYSEFEGQGRIRGSFRLGGQTLRDGWVEMIQLSGPPTERCGPGDCGLSVDALSEGWTYWTPGRWRVMAPPVKGWGPPAPFEIVVRPDELTTFEAEYVRTQDA
jgi:hypothetical protein